MAEGFILVHGLRHTVSESWLRGAAARAARSQTGPRRWKHKESVPHFLVDQEAGPGCTPPPPRPKTYLRGLPKGSTAFPNSRSLQGTSHIWDSNRDQTFHPQGHRSDLTHSGEPRCDSQNQDFLSASLVSISKYFVF